MLRYLTAISLSVLLIAVSVSAGPKMSLSEQSFEFGYVPQKARISHTFTLTSTGTDSLKILKVITGCGCTKAPITKTELGIGESTDLEIIFDTKTYTKKIAKAPRIMTNESSNPTRVNFSAVVVPSFENLTPLTVQPSKIITTGGQKSGSYEFIITNVSDQPIAVTMVDQAGDYFIVHLPDVIPPASSVRGSLQLVTEKGIDRQLEKSFTFELGDENKTRYTIPVVLSSKVLSTR